MFKAENYKVGYQTSSGANLSWEFNFELPPGGLILQGRSGSGKSTLLKSLCGLSVPLNGSLYYDGELLSDFEGFRKKVAYIPQKINFSSGRFRDFVESLYEKAGHDAAPLRLQKIAHILVELQWDKSLINQQTEGLSGGELQALIMALCISGGPEYLLIDEGTSAMDSQHKGACLQYLTLQLKTTLKGFLFVTHDLELAAKANIPVISFSETCNQERLS